MSGAGKPGAVRGMAAGLGAPVWAKGLGPGESGCICLLSSHVSGLLPRLLSSRVTIYSLYCAVLIFTFHGLQGCLTPTPRNSEALFFCF